jgi:hypothetical protein
LSNHAPSKSNLTVAALAVAVDSGPVYDLLVRRCGLCERELSLEAGDVTFGGEWYHAACWILVEPDLPSQRRTEMS